MKDSIGLNTILYNLRNGKNVEEMEKAFAECRSYVSATARANRRSRIIHTPWYAVKDWGILGRLRYEPETQRVYYICGQEWNTEHSILRDAFD